MVMDFIATWGKWTWLILAGIFFVLELVAPGAFMLWLGLSALLVGIITLFVVWPLSYQFIAFAVLALISLPIWRRWRIAWRSRSISRSSIAAAMVSSGASSRWRSRSSPAPAR